MTPEEFREYGHRLIDWIIDYRQQVATLPVAAAVQPGEIAAMLPEHPPSTPDGFDALIADLDRVVVPGLTHWQHPSFFAYFPANAGYPSILAELVSAGLGVQGMSWVTSPAVTEVEQRMMDWMVELLALPESFRSSSAEGGGVIHGSASEATLASVLAARWRVTAGQVNLDGDTSRLVAYATSQAHSSIEKGLRIAGIGTDRLRLVAHDANFAMRPDALAEAIAADRAAGLEPFWVCATRGSTSSMAFDPLPEIGRIARAEGVWLHVDAAMAGIAALVPEHRWVNDGLELADSYCTNPHKWMGIAFDYDLFYTADRRALLGALSILPEYLRSAAAESGSALDYRDWQVPLGRRFRALKLWFTLRTDGIAPTQAMIRRQVSLTAELAGWVAADERFEIVAPAPLNLLCLRLRAGDTATEQLISDANASGEALFTRTVLDGGVALRFSIGGATTEREHVLAGWELLQRVAAPAPAGPALGSDAAS
ncbi:MAG: pyridoxal-dependent decarboxylase [Micropruina sp.]